MVSFNGGLTKLYGLYSATVIIHIVGLLLIIIIVISKREHPFAKRYTWYFYLGGAVGVLTTVFNNFAFTKISVSSILALGLFGQSIAALIIDQYGLLNMQKHVFRKRKISGLLLILFGIISMTNNFHFLAVLFSFFAGANIVVSRTLNARLAGYTSVRISTFYNYLIGIIFAIAVCFLFGKNEAAFSGFFISARIYVYFGGILGVCVVLLNIITVTKVSAFYLSLFSFIGQIFSGVIIDAIISQAFSPRNIIGGFFVTAGLCVNLLLDRKKYNYPEETLAEAQRTQR